MANLKASKKDILVNRRNRLRNQHFKSQLKTSIKRALAAIQDTPKEAEATVKAALRLIDKTASKGIIKKQTASRKKSKLSLALNKAQG